MFYIRGLASFHFSRSTISQGERFKEPEAIHNLKWEENLGSNG